MKKISKLRHGFLQLLVDQEAELGKNIPFYLGTYDRTLLNKYGLTLWDKATVTWAEKAGLITIRDGSFAKITDEGRKVLEEAGQFKYHD